MENFIKFKLVGGKCKRKSDIVSHIFQCQPNRVFQSQDLNRPAFKKINRKREVEEILHSSFKSTCKENFDPAKKTRETNSLIDGVCISTLQSNPVLDYSFKKNDVGDYTNNIDSCCTTISQNITLPKNVEDVSLNSKESVNFQIPENDRPKAFGEGSYIIQQLEHELNMVSRGVQVNLKDKKPHFRSKAILCKPLVKNRCQYIGTLLPPNVFIAPAHYFLFFKSFISCN